jgi:hypothetical protein
MLIHTIFSFLIQTDSFYKPRCILVAKPNHAICNFIMNFNKLMFLCATKLSSLLFQGVTELDIVSAAKMIAI